MHFQNIFSPLILVCFLSCKHREAAKPLVEQEVDTEVSSSRYENFDQVDTTKWEYSLYSFTGNACNMRKENVISNHSTLLFRTELNSSKDLPLPYNAGGLSDKRFHLFGYYSIYMKVPACAGTVSGLFLMNEYQVVNWEHKGIDTEFPGNNSFVFQSTTMENYVAGDASTYTTNFHPLNFNSSADFHEYGVLWTPDSISWFVDQRFVATSKAMVPQVPLRIVLLNYIGDANVPGIKQWLGALKDTSLPATMEVDWIHLETLDEYAKRKQIKR